MFRGWQLYLIEPRDDRFEWQGTNGVILELREAHAHEHPDMRVARFRRGVDDASDK